MLTAHRGVAPATLSTRQGAVVCAEFDTSVVGLFVGWSRSGASWTAWQKANDSKRDLSARFDSMCKRLKHQHQHQHQRQQQRRNR